MRKSHISPAGHSWCEQSLAADVEKPQKHHKEQKSCSDIFMAEETSVISHKTFMRNSLLITKLLYLQLSLASQSVLAPVLCPFSQNGEVHGDTEWMPPAPSAAQASEEAETRQITDKTGSTFRLHFLTIKSEMSAVRQCQSFTPRAHNYHFLMVIKNPNYRNPFPSVLHMDGR